MAGVVKFGLSPLQSGGDFDTTIAECERAEAAGFDSVWLGEHHNSILLYPAPLVGLAAIAARTRRVRLGTGVLLLPLYHPLAVAEEAAMVDVISRGRLILGVGAGYAPEEFAAFGISTKERGSRLDEAVPLIHRLWTEDAVSHEGRHYRITNATLRPRPVQRPRPPVWFAGWVEAALRRAGRLVGRSLHDRDRGTLRVHAIEDVHDPLGHRVPARGRHARRRPAVRLGGTPLAARADPHPGRQHGDRRDPGLRAQA